MTANGPTVTTSLGQAGDIQLCFDEWEGDGPIVIFLHATGLSRGCWRPVAQAVANRCRPIAVDLRGHGGSDRPGEGYDWPTLADDIGALIRARSWAAPIIVGHSVGGSTAVEVATRAGVDASALILTEPVLVAAARSASSSPSPLIDRTRRRRSSWPTQAEAREFLGSREPFSLFAPDVFDSWLETAIAQGEDEWQLTSSPLAEAAVYENTHTSRASDYLDAIACPVLLLRATGSLGLRTTCPPGVAGAIRDCTEFVVPGSGHFVPLQYPEMVVALVDLALENR